MRVSPIVGWLLLALLVVITGAVNGVLDALATSPAISGAFTGSMLLAAYDVGRSVEP